MAKDDFTTKWYETFQSIAENVSEDLLSEAKLHSNTYRDASTFIKRINQLTFGDISEPVDRAGRTVAGTICDLALYKLHEEERDLPIDRGSNK